MLKLKQFLILLNVFRTNFINDSLPFLSFNFQSWINVFKYTCNILYLFNNVSCRIFGSFGNPTLKKLEFRLYPPLSYFGHLVSQDKIHYLGSLPHYRFRIGSNRICCTNYVYIKVLFGAKIYGCIFCKLQITRVWESQSFVWS